MSPEAAPQHPGPPPDGAPRAPARYAFAVAAVALALLLCIVLRAILAPNYFMVFLAAVALAAWRGGLGPGLLCGGLSALSMAYFLISPVRSLVVETWEDAARLAVFAAFAWLVSSLSERLRAARAEAEDQAEEAARLAMQLQDQATELEAHAEEVQALNEELEEQIEEAACLRDELEAANTQLRASVVEQHRALDALREREERFRTMADGAPVMIWTSGTDGLCNFFNRPWLEFTGRTLEEELGNGWAEGVHPEDHARCLEVYHSAFEARRPFEMEYRLRGADGEYRWVLDSAVPLSTPAGEFSGYVGSCIDVHDRRLEQEREQFLLRAGTVLGASLDPERTLAELTRLLVPALADYCSVDMVTPGGEIRRVDAAHRDPGKERVLRDVWARYPYRADGDEGVPQVLRTREPVLVPRITPEATAAFAQDAEHRQLLLSLDPRSYVCVPLVARDRVLGALSLVMSDSGRRYGPADLQLAGEVARRAAVAIDNARLYAAVVEANQAKSDFMAVMSHELRTPLNAVIGYTDLFLLGIPTALPEPLRPQVERIRTAARHLLRMIEEILTFSRIEAGREEVRLASVEAAALAEEAAALVEPLALERGLAFRVEVPPAGPALVTDPGRAQQVLVNLLGNAVKFTERGEVSLRLEEEPGAVLFTVRDTGVGIPREQHERIFDPFWQVDQSISRRSGGTGLGLSVARQLARLLGGDVTLESAPGEGSAFTLRLPREPARPAPAPLQGAGTAG